MTEANDYEAPAITIVGSLEDLTKGGNVPVNELPNQTNTNNDAYGPVSS